MNKPTNNAELAAEQLPTQAAQSPQPPAENPLDQLRDIHLPEPIDGFPYAPGWWILLAIVLIFIGYFIYRKIKYRQAIRLLVPAKNELNQLRALTGEAINGHAIATLSALLKRVCLLYFSKSQVAGLSGSRWLEFLNSQVANQQNNQQVMDTPLFDEKACLFFSQAAYQKSTQLELADWHHLIDASEKCIEIIIKQAAHKKLSGSKRVNSQQRAVEVNQ